ncbi:MAG: 3-deoxy-manno-octulosonate cytidylyltransferase [Bacteroidales bacterium]|nr:3-deoxy-manno-octulosonate cytidylyltransferase [Bacteroidales bacterium]
MEKDEILGLIPARYASTRFPGKPLADIGGKPMIARVYENVSKALGHVAVATDDVRIAEAVEAFGGRVVMTSTSHRSGTDRCAEAASKVEAEDGRRYGVVMNIQGDEPFISPAQVELLASAFEDARVGIATLVKHAEHEEDVFNPNKPKVAVSAGGFALYFSRSPIPYLRGVAEHEWMAKHSFWNHIGLYAYRTSTLHELTKLEPGTLERCESLEQLRWLENGYSIKVLETEIESLSIDTPEDLEELRRRGLI